jgi:hypothetical protein
LTWNAAENATSYTIYNGDDIVATSVTETSYMIEGLDANTTYCFTVTAVNEEVGSTTEDPYNGYEYVDLGLPSGLKWATCNIGASEPEECGNYYAWGETITKNQYNEQTSLVWGQRLDDISGNPQYDAASANWGGKWRMPTKDEMEELLTECDWEQTTMNDVVGYKFASKTNDNYIFLPSAGIYSDTNIASVGETLFYWSSTSEWEDLAGYARTYLLNDFLSMMFGPIHVSQIIMGHAGLSVRPCFPESWDKITARRQYRGNMLYFTYFNNNTGKMTLTVDGKEIEGNLIPLFDDNKDHEIIVNM